MTWDNCNIYIQASWSFSGNPYFAAPDLSHIMCNTYLSLLCVDYQKLNPIYSYMYKVRLWVNFVEMQMKSQRQLTPIILLKCKCNNLFWHKADRVHLQLKIIIMKWYSH